MHRALGIVLVALCAASSVLGETPKPPCGGVHNNLKYVAYLISKPQDRAGCSMSVENGALTVSRSLTNPGMSCPDMFAWKLFVGAVSQEFWKGWAGDEYTWPNLQPYPLCGPGVDPTKCCQPGRATNPGYDDKDNPAKFCPYFPGDHMSRHPLGVLRVGSQPGKAHLPTFLQPNAARAPVRGSGANDPGRVIRQSMAELVYRNKAMFDYTFENNLYNQEGIAAVFKNNAANVKAGAPYHRKNVSGVLTEIEYPAEAVMIKSNWLNAKRAAEIGLKDDPANPYVKINLLSPVIDNDQEIFEAGEHWLVSMHISSKDTPNWLWATFEHVNNPGRCDFTGCNDSYGYATTDPIAAGQADNYTMPNTRCDDLLLPGWVYDVGKTYPTAPASAGLRKVFFDLQMGTRENDSLNPTPRDMAWLSYRLKGSQSDFTDSMGRPTLVGNSITEGGFVATSSCVTCHARAGTTATGTIPPALGIFLNQASETGYMQSASGSPNADWFHRSAQPPTLMVLQTDFVWGVLAALCVNPTCDSGCPNTPDSCSTPSSSPTAPIASPAAPTHPIRKRIRNSH